MASTVQNLLDDRARKLQEFPKQSFFSSENALRMLITKTFTTKGGD